MPRTTFSETALTAGQNEGVERALLPLPQLSYVQNARMRKVGRWGKRYGTTQFSSVTIAGNALGSGSGKIRAIGPGCCIVDDQCYVYSNVANAWVDPKAIAPVNASAASLVANPRIPGAVSGWLPDKAYFPVPSLNQINQQKTSCAQAYALGYLFTATTLIDPAHSTDVMIRVAAIDPGTQAVVFLQDVRASTAGDGGVTYPRLVVCGSTLILGYASRLAGASRSISGRVMTSIGGGFGAEILVTSGVGSAGIFDMAPYSASQLLGVVSTGNTATVGIFNASNLSLANAVVYTDALPAITGSSIVGSASAGIFLTVTATNAVGPVDATRVAVYTSGLVLLGTANVATDVSYPAYSTLLPGGGVRCVYGYALFSTLNLQAFRYRDVSAAGAIASIPLQQTSAQPISRPFTIGSQVYVWTTNVTVFGAFGYANLLRLPAVSEYSGTFPAGIPVPVISAPLGMSANDFLVRTGPPNVDPLGVPAVAQIGSSATYALIYPVLPAIPNINSPFAHEWRVLQATHYSDAAAYRSVNVVSADGSSFAPGGTLTRIDARGAVESGFADPPRIIGSIQSSTGQLTVNKTYEYVAVFLSRNSGGRFEQSRPSAVYTAAMGATGNTVLLQWETLGFGARQDVSIEIYRTAGNGSIFNLVTTVDGASLLSTPSYLDGASDVSIASNKVLYTQVGQTLPNAFPPPSRFVCVGGQRLILGGLLRGDVVQVSKLIFGDQSPSFADHDAFRIVVPGICTGLAWLDNLVTFTADRIYVVPGDGPDDSGQGAFSPPVALPFPIGCIEPRSVFTTDEGTFFQSARGLYLLPRGFAAPIPAGDVVQDTLAAYPIITGVACVTKPGEQTVRWSCVDSAAASNGVQIVYDLVHKVWSVDTINDFSVSTTAPHISISSWFNGEVALAEPNFVGFAFKRTDSSYADCVFSSYTMMLRTGDVRLFGNMSHGVVERIGMLSELRAACTLNVTKTTDRGSSVASKVYSGVPPENVAGDNVYVSVSLGSSENRDVTALRLQFDETSTTEGLAFIALAIEHGDSQGFRLVKPTDWVT